MTPCLDCGAPLGPVTDALSIHFCKTCSARYRASNGGLLYEKITARLQLAHIERFAKDVP